MATFFSSSGASSRTGPGCFSPQGATCAKVGAQQQRASAISASADAFFRIVASLFMLPISISRFLSRHRTLPWPRPRVFFLLKLSARKAVSERRLHGWCLVAEHQRLLRTGLLLHRKPTLGDDLHGALNWNAEFALGLVDPTVVVKQQVLATVQVNHVLRAVVSLEARR